MTMTEWLQRFDPALWSQGLLAPSHVLLDPSSRLFWGFCLSSLFLAVIVLFLQHRKTPAEMTFGRLLRSRLLAADYWFNRSSLVDVLCLVGNSVLRIGVVIPLLGTHLALAIIVARSLQTHLGNSPLDSMTLEIPTYLLAVLYTGVFFIAEDFSRFILHVAMHKSPWLWRLHRLHHSATHLTPLTLFRVHPLEMALYYGRGLLVFGLVSGLFIYVFGGRLTGLQILGVDALGFLFNLMGANLRHSHVWWSFGRLERWFLSPAQHQLHHSAAAEHRDRNFGTCLAVWDRCFGSVLFAQDRPQKLRFGLSADTPTVSI